MYHQELPRSRRIDLNSLSWFYAPPTSRGSRRAGEQRTSGDEAAAGAWPLLSALAPCLAVCTLDQNGKKQPGTPWVGHQGPEA